MSYVIDTIAYQVEVSVDATNQLLMIFSREGEQVWGCVVRGWERAGEWEIVADVGVMPSDVNWGLLSAMGQARDYADLIPRSAAA